MDKQKDLKDYMDHCKKLRGGDHGQYTLYIYGFLLPWLQEQREQGKLVKGKYISRFEIAHAGNKRFSLRGTFDYVGELDREGNAAGFGVATRVSDKNHKFEGTFLNDKPEGVCKFC